jgi:serine/threonine-protein kinase
VLYLLKQIAGSLEEAHQLGLLHRDLKPSNIMVGSKGGLGDFVKVLDFGIACSVAGGGEDNTRSTALVGTPAFLAPERIRTPQLLDLRSDIYSFGAVAFHLLTGRNVFEGASPTELIYQVLSTPRPSPSQLRGETLPEPLEQLVLRCLAIDPELRPANFREILELLKTVAPTDVWSQDEARAWWSTNRDAVARFIQATS